MSDPRATSPFLEAVPLMGAPLVRDANTEVVVVGAGAAGMSAALALARAGRAVTVLERRSVASGLTGRCSGAVLASSGRWYARDVRDMGEERARARRSLAEAGLRHAVDLVQAHDLACGLEREGAALLALSPREWADAVKSAELLGAFGVRGDLMDRATVRHRAVAGLFAGGVSEDEDVCLDPAAFTRGLARLAIGRGAVLHEGTEVTGFEEPAGGGVIVHTPRGNVECAMLVLAVNAWTPALVPSLADRVLPHRAQWLLTEPMRDTVPDGVWITNHGHEHWRRLASGAVLFGGCREAAGRSEDVLSEESTGKIQGLMERFLSRAFPALAEPVVTHRWAAAACTTCDGLPLIGPPPGSTGVVLCCGFAEHELALAIGAGMTAADLMQAGRLESAEPFSVRRFL